MSKFKVGQILRVNSNCPISVKDNIRYFGGNPHYLEVRELDPKGNPIFIYEDENVYSGYSSVDFFSEISSSAAYRLSFYVIKASPTAAWARPVRYNSMEDAKEWITQNGTPGDKYRIQESINHGLFRVARKTVNTLESV
jgi:hypothetical protein